MTFLIDQLNLPDEISTELARLSTTYEFVGLSDKGQNGYLFIARNRVIDRQVAIKFYFWADGTREHVEPKSLAAGKSESVIDVLDASLVGEEWAMFVTPCCENGDLDKYREGHRFGLRSALEFTSKLLDGVAALHEHKFVHRDLKPENLLVSDDGWPLIADFGSVRSIPDGQDDVAGSGHAVLYRPPESFETTRYDKRGDLYQCGIVLFQVLGGRLPYAYQEYLSEADRKQYAHLQDAFDRYKLVEGAIRKKAQSGKLLDLNSLPFFVPPTVKSLLRKAANPEPAKRFQSASDFMNAVNQLSNRVVDWQYDGNEVIAQGKEKRYRVEKAGRLFVVEQNSGKGWRKVPGCESASLSHQLNFISDKCKR
jgi:serine/threonine protein kinase